MKVLASKDKGNFFFLANGESYKINDLLVRWCNYSGWKSTNLSRERGGLTRCRGVSQRR